MEENFVVIDVETANRDYSSICQIGLVEFRSGMPCREWTTLVNPRVYFEPNNIRIHRIKQSDVVNAPELKEALLSAAEFIGDSLIASYGPFDQSSVHKALLNCNLPILNNVWLDIIRVVRRTWPESYAQKNYSLKNVCYDQQVSLQDHHDALCDAKAAGMLLCKAINHSGVSLDSWISRVNKRIPVKGIEFLSDEIIVNEDGPLFGEVIVFTGSLTIPRNAAHRLAASAGCTVKNSVTTKTTILVVGDQDVFLVGDTGKSSKQRQAEQLAEAGQPIKFIGETDFVSMINISAPDVIQEL